MTTTPRNKRNYAVGRAKLIAFLGGCCLECGSAHNIELHHEPASVRPWPARSKNRWCRLAEYRRAAKQGALRPLCKRCHARRQRCGA